MVRLILLLESNWQLKRFKVKKPQWMQAIIISEVKKIEWIIHLQCEMHMLRMSLTQQGLESLWIATWMTQLRPVSRDRWKIKIIRISKQSLFKNQSRSYKWEMECLCEQEFNRNTIVFRKVDQPVKRMRKVGLQIWIVKFSALMVSWQLWNSVG